MLKDFDRPLNPRGLRDAPFMAKLLKAKKVNPDLIISSPANRALTTAGYFAEELNIPKENIDQRAEIYEALTVTIQDMISDLDNALNTVVIFGHNPTLTSLANLYHEKYIPNVPTCGIVEIQADIDDWKEFNEETARRTNFHYPKEYFT